ncbi:MAG TPA: hypothetical protein VM389_08600 [Phycisphaerae bacterium]|nr:hypothetical protein [Phycisphaerae bacterium]HUU22581.1 hypothetical protein [Phycisphaerae bacterium]
MTMSAEDYEDRRRWMDAYIAAGGAWECADPAGRTPDEPELPCEQPNCNPTRVDLEVEKALLTLKHDRDCRLNVVVEPDDVQVQECKIEIRRESAADWCTLSRRQTEDPWQAKIAGKFKLRGVVKICGREHTTAEKSVEVQFPDYGEITGDAGVHAACATEWQQTLADCTEDPNRRRERGFWIRLNTATNAYEFTATLTGSWRGPTQGASVPLPARPADAPATPAPCDAGATYSVASFHTHTPTAFRAALVPAGSTRGVGPSGADQGIDTGDQVPGVVNDYTESPAGSGSIPMGHPENSAAQLYHSLGLDRRPTPN